MSSEQQPFIKFKPGQEEAFWCELRIFFMLWRRQYGKSFTLGSRAMRRMMQRKNHAVIFVSASILLGSEWIRKEAEVWRIVMSKYREMLIAQGQQQLTTTADDDNGNLLDVDAIADLFEHQKLETRIYHNNVDYSRTQVVAPNPDTAVGWTGDVYLDEVARIASLKDVFEAVMPFIDSNPEFEMIMATTAPPDDSHDSFELFLPPAQEWETNPRGNWYRSPSGIMVHRLDAWDGAAGGAVYYHPETGKVVTPEEHRATYFDKRSWDRNHGVKFITGGVSAVPLMALQNAMEKGKDTCMGNYITDEIKIA